MTKSDIEKLSLTGTLVVLLIFFIFVIIIFSRSFNNTFETNAQNIEEDIFENQKQNLQHQVLNLVNRIDVRRKKSGDFLREKIVLRGRIITALINSLKKDDSYQETTTKKLLKAYHQTIQNSFFLGVFNASGEIVFIPGYLSNSGELYNKASKVRNGFIHLNTSRGLSLAYVQYNKIYGYYIIIGGFFYQIENRIKNEIINILNDKSSIELSNKEYFFIQKVSKDDKGRTHLSCIVNPKEKKRVNQPVDLNEKDAEGKFYKRSYLNIIKSDKKNKDIFLIHYYLKEGFKDQRITYYYYYKPWGWIFARGFYVEKIHKKIFQEKNYLKIKFLREIKTNFILFLGIVFLLAIISWLFTRRIGKIFEYYNQLVQTQNSNLKEKNENLILEFKLREKIERALESNEELYHSTIDSLIDSIIVTNSQNRILMVNTAFEKFLNDKFNIKRSIGSDLFDLNPFFRSLSGFFNRVSSIRDVFTVQENRAIQGKKQYFEFRIIPLIGVDKSIRRFILIIRDLTKAKNKELESRNMEVKMLSQSKMATLGEMATSIAHEIYQPLNFISGFVQLLEIDLKNSQIDEKGLQEMIQRTHRSIKRITDIIDHLRIFGRADQIEKSGVKLMDVIENTLILLQERLRIRSIQLDLEIPENLDLVNGNETQLEQVFINLFQNSIDAFDDFNPGEKNVHIEIEKEESGILIIYKDNAGGMKSEVKAKAFEPFFTTKEVGKGTGLGLAIIYGIIKDHDGDIIIETEENIGTSFIIRLPIYSKIIKKDESE